MQVITDATQITAKWFTAALEGTVALTTGQVSHFELVESESINSQIIHLKLRYAPSSQGTLPNVLLLKLCQDDAFDDSEVHYYLRDYLDLADAPLVNCYHAQYAPSPSRYHILMDDLSTTHRNNYNTPPTLEHGLKVARALAKLHAHWWGLDRLRQIEASIPDELEIMNSVELARMGLAPMLSRIRADVDSTWIEALYRVIERHPQLMIERIRASGGFTLIHGDVNPGNVLSPIGGDGKIYFIDRQPFAHSLRVWLGISDLAYVIVRPWDTDLRRRTELPILREYHQGLLQAGVQGYSWDQLLYDYRLSIVQNFYVTLARCADGEECDEMRWLWYPHLENNMIAYFDWGCDSLLRYRN